MNTLNQIKNGVSIYAILDDVECLLDGFDLNEAMFWKYIDENYAENTGLTDGWDYSTGNPLKG